MQEFTNTAIKLRELNPSQDVLPTKYYQEKLLSKERQQIIDAFDNGQANWDAKCQDYKNGTEYFNNTFK